MKTATRAALPVVSVVLGFFLLTSGCAQNGASTATNDNATDASEPTDAPRLDEGR